jgi:transcriptional regulator with XRE-family HTH domain
MYTQLADALRDARTTAGLTQHELARLLGVHDTTVWRVEAGLLRPREDLVRSWLRHTQHELQLTLVGVAA